MDVAQMVEHWTDNPDVDCKSITKKLTASKNSYLKAYSSKTCSFADKSDSSEDINEKTILRKLWKFKDTVLQIWLLPSLMALYFDFGRLE